MATVTEDDGSAWTAVAGCWSSDYTLGTSTVTYGQIPPAGVVSGTKLITMNNLGSSQPGHQPGGCKLAAVPLCIVAS